MDQRIIQRPQNTCLGNPSGEAGTLCFDFALSPTLTSWIFSEMKVLSRCCSLPIVGGRYLGLGISLPAVTARRD